MTVETPPVMATSWAQQPAAPPSLPARPLVTPAARAFLRARNVRLDLDGSTGLPRLIHLAEAHALARAAAANPDSASYSANHAALPAVNPGPRAFQDTLAGVDVLIPSVQDPVHRLAHVIAAAIGAMRRPATPPVRAVIRFPDPVAATGGSASVVLDDAGSLSVSGIERRLAAGGGTVGDGTVGETVDAQLEVVDGSGLGVTRLLASAEGRVVVTIGAAGRRVIPRRQQDGQEVIAASSVLEVWVHGGGRLDALETARLAGAVGQALATVDRA